MKIKSLGIYIDNLKYCIPYLWNIYAALLLSKAWNAESIFDSRVLNYLKYKFGVDSLAKKREMAKVEAFHKIFNTYLPNNPIIPFYALKQNLECSTCIKTDECKDIYLSQVEDNMAEIIKWRNYDEIQQVKNVIKKIINEKEKVGNIIEPIEIMHKFKSEQEVVRKRIKRAFLKVKRFANLSTILSIPVAIAGLSTDISLLTVAGVTVAGLSKVSKEIIDYLTNKYRWVAFLSSDSKEE